MVINNKEVKLVKDLETRFKTLMIGSLSRFENSFGYLWNHGDDPKTDSQEEFRDKWEDLRTDILNHGNNQIRQAVDELLFYFENKDKYEYNYNFVFDNTKKDRR